ncbi:pentatricopeptide repeat-containing protein [Quercus suber]|uniref:Pentatricopeptide repeat-containing protein n=1 Tax=Quercus suber TaxID=58331 RepID=A0AAW0K6M7_QUESU
MSNVNLNQHVLSVLAKCNHLNHLKQLQAFLIALGHSQTQFYAFKLVRFCALSLVNLPYARFIFDHLHSPNVYLYTAMITAYASHHHHSAFLLYRQMLRLRHPSPNHFIYPHVLKSCPHLSYSHATKMVHTQISKSGFLRYPEQHSHHGNRPNQVTIVCALSACGNTGMLQLGKGIHGYIYKNSINYDTFISNALIDMYGKCGNLKEARRVFDMTLNKSLTSWNSMINSFALHGQSESAITVFEEMMQCEGDVKPDEVTFVGLLNACTHGGLVEKGFSYFELMTRDYKIEPQIQHYGCLIDLLGRAGRFEEAMEVVREMSMEPDEVVWGSLLNGCKIHGRTDLAEFVVQKLIEIDPNNGGYGIMLANIYGELGKWDEVRKVRKILKDQNAYKTPGCSWIEVDNQVYQFYSVDKSHHRTEEIYKILESLLVKKGESSLFYCFFLLQRTGVESGRNEIICKEAAKANFPILAEKSGVERGKLNLVSLELSAFLTFWGEYKENRFSIWRTSNIHGCTEEFHHSSKLHMPMPPIDEEERCFDGIRCSNKAGSSDSLLNHDKWNSTKDDCP